jgi:hypothetical protein
MKYETADDWLSEAAAARHTPRYSGDRRKFNSLFRVAKLKAYFLVDLGNDDFGLERKHKRIFTGSYFDCMEFLRPLPDVGRPDLY